MHQAAAARVEAEARGELLQADSKGQRCTARYAALQKWAAQAERLRWYVHWHARLLHSTGRAVLCTCVLTGMHTVLRVVGAGPQWLSSSSPW